MNLRTTLVLIVLAVIGAITWRVGPRLPRRLDPSAPPPPAADAGTLDIFDNRLTEKNITSVRILRDGQPWLSFERQKDGWVLPGGWETRTNEAREIIRRLGTLQSRFQPLPVSTDEDLAKYGLTSPRFNAVIEAEGTKYQLAFGEGTVEDSNSFFRPTFVRLSVGSETKPEVIQLGPGLLAILGRPREFYLKRRLFPITREARSPTGRDKIERLAADSISAEQTSGGKYTLARVQDDWRLTAPAVDRVDEFGRNQVLEAVADLWAERFVTTSPADVAAAVGAGALAETGLPAAFTALAWARMTESQDWLAVRAGLVKPERTIQVTSPARGTITLQVGTISGMKTRAARPPETPPGVPPPPPPPGEEFRYARLKTKDIKEDLIFEINASRLRDIFTSASALRDTKLARFENKNVRRVDVTQGTRTLVLYRDPKNRWQIENPDDKSHMLAEENKINELLSSLSGLAVQAKEHEEVTTAAGLVGGLLTPGGPLVSLYPNRFRVDPSAAFAKPLATVTLTIHDEDESTGEKQTRTRKTKLLIGAVDEVNKQLLVKVDDWPRVEVAGSEAWTQIRKPGLAYRGKLFDFGITDVQKLVIEQEGKTVALTQANNKWKLTTPADTDADPGRVGQVLSQLSKLEPVEYVSENAPASELDCLYGLTKAPLLVTVQSGGKMKRLRLGKQREGKQEFFAQLDGSPSVFTVTADVHALLKADSLAFLPLQLWRVEPDQLRTVRVEKDGAEPYTLLRQGETWKLSEPVDAPALESVYRALLDVLASPHCDRYEALSIKDAKDYGFDKPFLKLSLAPEKANEAKRELIVGKKVKNDSPDRFARRPDSPVVFVLRGDVVTTFDRGVLDLVDTLLLNVNLENVQSIHSQSGEAKLLLKPDGKTWKVHEATPAPFAADENALAALRGKLLGLRAEKFAAYGSKLDLPKHGLDKPFAKLMLVVQEGGKSRDVVLALGAEVPGKAGQRYARLDSSPGIVILSVNDTRILSRTYLDYVDHKVLGLAPDRVTSVQRQKGMETLELAKQDDEWRLLKPQDQRADDRKVDGLLRQLADLRAASVAEYPLKDAKKFGFETPFTVVTFKLASGQHVLTLGDETPQKNGQRYAKSDMGQTVFVLPAEVVKGLEAAPLTFRTRALARFSDAEKILIERDQRQATFSRVGGTWTMTAPLEAKVDNDQMEEFLNKAARLEADELVADKPGDLKPYGLDKPVARWRFQADGKDVLDLVLGKRDATGKRCYARLGKDGVVFLLGADMTAKALGEFRDRTVWTMPIDSAQGDTLVVTHDGKTVTLKREGTLWSCVEKPTAKVNGETVNDTMAALAGLKLERYAVDRGGDRKLFGLAPPVFILEGVAGEKKAVLHIGRFEGDSKQAYACLADKERTDVFILSEADSTRLTRDLEALGKQLPVEKKK